MALAAPAGQALAFRGFLRADGSVGIRNHLLVVPSVICANTVAQRVASLIPGAVAVPHPHGCAQVGDDVTLTEKVLAGAAASPNVGAALVIGLGCETCQSGEVAELARALAPGKPVEAFSIQEAGGSIKAIAQGVEAGKRLMAAIAAQPRHEVPVESLVLAVDTGEPDETTGSAAVPAVAAVAKRLLELGGTVLVSPASSGLLGAAHGVLAPAERPPSNGCFVVDTPAHDVVALTAKAIAGAHLCLYATGRGSPLGSALYPVIKVCANVRTIAQMEDNIDFSATGLLDGTAAMEELAEQLFRVALDVCNGQLTHAEIIGHQEFAIHRVGPTV